MPTTEDLLLRLEADEENHKEWQREIVRIIQEATNAFDLTEKNPIDDDDLVIIQDSEDEYSFKKVKLSTFGGGGADLTSIARDGSRSPTADINWNGFDLLTNAPLASNIGDTTNIFNNVWTRWVGNNTVNGLTIKGSSAYYYFGTDNFYGYVGAIGNRGLGHPSYPWGTFFINGDIIYSSVGTHDIGSSTNYPDNVWTKVLLAKDTAGAGNFQFKSVGQNGVINGYLQNAIDLQLGTISKLIIGGSSSTFYTDLSMNNHYIASLNDPINDQDAVNKRYCNGMAFHIFVVNFSGMLDKLDNDAGVSDTNYSNNNIDQAYDWITNFNDVLTKLDNDSGVSDINYNSTLAITDPADMRTNFNDLLTKLDNDAGVSDINYSTLYSF